MVYVLGPDKYKVEKVETKVNNAGLICSRDMRFKEDKNVTPGPAAYSVSHNSAIKGQNMVRWFWKGQISSSTTFKLLYSPIVECTTEGYTTQGNIQRHS